MESKTKYVIIVVIILLTVTGVVLGLVFGLKSKSGGTPPSPYPPGPGPYPPDPTPTLTPRPTVPPPDCGHGTFSPAPSAKGGVGYCNCNKGWLCGKWIEPGDQSCPVEPGTKYKCNIPAPAPPAPPACILAGDDCCNHPQCPPNPMPKCCNKEQTCQWDGAAWDMYCTPS